MSDDTIDTTRIDVDRFEHETDKACLFKVDGEDLWIPKSVIEDWTDKWVTVAAWWAEKENME